MSKLYPTIFNELEDFGPPAYKQRGNEFYPTIYNRFIVLVCRHTKSENPVFFRQFIIQLTTMDFLYLK